MPLYVAALRLRRLAAGLPEAVATNFTVAISLYGLDPMSAMNARKFYNFPAQA